MTWSNRMKFRLRESRLSCLSNVSYVVDLTGHKAKGSFIEFFKFAGTSLTTVMPQLWTVIKMWCNESTISTCPQVKKQYFLQTIENSNLLTLQQILQICPSNFSLLSRVAPRSSNSSWIGIMVPSEVNTGFLLTLPKVIAWYFEWFLFIWLNSYHSSIFFRSALMAC